MCRLELNQGLNEILYILKSQKHFAKRIEIAKYVIKKKEKNLSYIKWLYVFYLTEMKVIPFDLLFLILLIKFYFRA